MKIQPIVHKTLAEAVAGKLTASLLDGSLQPGTQLPPERELITRFGISRTTLREALKTLERNGLVESRKNVGWFAQRVDESNMTQAREMSATARQAERSARNEPPTGPIRLPIASEKPIHIPNLQTDRLGTFDFISWWDREKVQNAKVMVVGAGALGNEVIKNLALMGIGNIFIVDFDKIEMANLSRSVLFRETDNNRLMLTADITAGGIVSVTGSPRMRRLKADYELMQDLNARSDLISFKAMDARPGVPPERYIVTFACKSISTVDRTGNPQYSNHHQVEIYLHSQYPQRWPGMKWLTPIWHPNINHLNGTVCIDAAW